MLRNLRELWQYRGLLWALTVRELKARYRASVLGFLWTFLNPSLSMGVYVVVFGFLMDTGLVRYPLYVFSGLLPWIYFSSSVLGGTSAVSDRRDLLTKVRFPAQVLPATVVLTNLVNFCLSVPLLLGLSMAYQHWPTWHVVFAVPVVLVQTLFTLAITYLLSALNVTFRDLQHIVANVMQMVFFLSPVVWSLDGIRGRSGFDAAQVQQAIQYGNPVAAVMVAWRDIFYEHRVPAGRPLLWVAVVSIVFLAISSAIFEKRREDFAELI
jgi:lipopolysaccharide transport system permease protein